MVTPVSYSCHVKGCRNAACSEVVTRSGWTYGVCDEHWLVNIPDVAPLVPLPWQYDDGGRAVAGFKGSTGDCVCRSIAIATGMSYRVVYDLLNERAVEIRANGSRAQKRDAKGSGARTGVNRIVYESLLMDLGWRWVPTMKIGSGCRVHVAEGDLPGGPLVLRLSKHVAAVVDGVLRDTYDSGRGGSRCVYGYFEEGGDIL